MESDLHCNIRAQPLLPPLHKRQKLGPVSSAGQLSPRSHRESYINIYTYIDIDIDIVMAEITQLSSLTCSSAQRTERQVINANNKDEKMII